MNTKKIFNFICILLVGAMTMFSTGCSDDDDDDTNISTDFEVDNEYFSAIVEDAPAYTAIPAGLTVKIYCINTTTFDGLDVSGTGTFVSEFSFSGTTTANGTTISYQIPTENDGDDLYPFVMVILDPTLNATDVEGLTLAQIFALTDESGDLALGYVYSGIGEDPYEPISFTASINGGEVELKLFDITVLESLMATY